MALNGIVFNYFCVCVREKIHTLSEPKFPVTTGSLRKIKKLQLLAWGWAAWLWIWEHDSPDASWSRKWRNLGTFRWRDFLFLWFIYPPKGRFLRIRIWVSWSLSILRFIPSPQRRGVTLLWFWRESWAYILRLFPFACLWGLIACRVHSLLLSCPDKEFLRQLPIERPRTGRLVGYAHHELGTYASKSLQLKPKLYTSELLLSAMKQVFVLHLTPMTVSQLVSHWIKHHSLGSSNLAFENHDIS